MKASRWIRSSVVWSLFFMLPVAASAATQEVLENSSAINTLWVLVCAALVFFMQAGFKALESGMVRPLHTDGIAVKNLIDFVVGALAFFMVGYGLMFGPDLLGVSGSFQVGLSTIPHSQSIPQSVFFLFQLGFVGTSLTIISGAMSGRTGLLPYILTSVVVAIFIYPLFGHWAWGNLWLAENKPWLASIGFVDFAGATVVHSVGAWVALIGVWMVGPRIGRFTAQREVQAFRASNYSYAVLGAMILWFGWWGFNGGSLLAFNSAVGDILINTNLAAVSGALMATVHAYVVRPHTAIIEKMVGGLLTGLVAITAGCHVVTAEAAIVIGLIAGWLHNVSYDYLLHRLHIDDAVGAIPVHGIGGAFGTLAVALFGQAELLPLPRWQQMLVQALGVIVAFIFAGGSAYMLFSLLKRTVGLRVSPEEEMKGVLWGHKRGTQLSVAAEEPLEALKKGVGTEVTYVSVKVSDGGFNLKTVDEYLQIPLDERYQLLDEEKVQYWDEQGRSVDKLLAARQLARLIEGERNQVIEERDRVNNQHQHVTDSIRYARKIQKAATPSNELFLSIFPESFVLNKPRDIVSGDFYWVRTKGSKRYLALADCTGHGVPGGYLSMLGIALLNELVRGDIPTPDQILNKLRGRVKHALSQDNVDVHAHDGMNISLLVFDDEKHQLQYAGAYHPLYIVRQQPVVAGVHGDSSCQLIEIKADRMPIGASRRENEPFTLHTIDLQASDEIYTLTDGYIDQFGGPYDKRIGLKAFRQLIQSLNPKSMSEQQQQLEDYLHQWKGDGNQIDDILVIGLKYGQCP